MDILAKYNFKPAAKIHVHKSGMNFEMLDDQFKENTGMVYAWVHAGEIMYVGMAGKGIRKRLTEHRGGMSEKHGSGTGFRNRNFILGIGGTVEVWGRICNTATLTYVDVNGNTVTETVSVESKEEDQFLEILKPKWNTVGMK